MQNHIDQASKVGIVGEKCRSPNNQKYIEVRSREHLLPEEVTSMQTAIKKYGGKHAHRNATLILLMYRHGLRISEASSLKWEQVDFGSAAIYINRAKGGVPSTHPLYGDELRALRQLRRDYPDSAHIFQSNRGAPLATDTIADIIEEAAGLSDIPFSVHAHMLRHGCGYYLANKGIDTRAIQAYLGHKNIQHTVRYTELAPGRFQGFWE